jgi:hypothetical protein
MSAFSFLAIGGAVLLGVIAALLIYHLSRNERFAECKRRQADFIANWRKVIEEAMALDEVR